MSTDKITVSLVQMEVQVGNPDKNREKAAKFIQQAARRKSKLAVLPELWTTGYTGDIKALAEPISGETTSMLESLAAKYGIYILGSIAELRGESLYNTAPVVGPEGLVGAYSKTHLIKLMGEHEIFSPGSSCQTFPTKYGKMGVMICYDVRFPELARCLTLSGARIIVVPAEWPYPRVHHWRYLLLARAIENQVFVIAVNRVGRDEKFKYFGHSMIVDPTGEIVVEGNESEDLITCDLALSKIEEIRTLLPCLEERRTDIYGSVLF